MDKISKLTDTQIAFGGEINSFIKRLRDEKVSYDEWSRMACMYDFGRRFINDTSSLINLADVLISHKPIITSIEEADFCDKACNVLRYDVELLKSFSQYDENGMLITAFAWSDAQKREIMGFNKPVYIIKEHKGMKR